MHESYRLAMSVDPTRDPKRHRDILIQAFFSAATGGKSECRLAITSILAIMAMVETGPQPRGRSRFALALESGDGIR
jgi:hypothetical protein